MAPFVPMGLSTRDAAEGGSVLAAHMQLRYAHQLVGLLDVLIPVMRLEAAQRAGQDPAGRVLAPASRRGGPPSTGGAAATFHR